MDRKTYTGVDSGRIKHRHFMINLNKMSVSERLQEKIDQRKPEMKAI